MLITSSLTNNISDYASKPNANQAPDANSFLTASDVKMLEYVTDTTSLTAALQNPHAQILATSMSYKREHGTAQGDFSQYYMPAQLTASDAKMVESMTGTTNIIDAQNAGSQGVDDLIGVIGLDRGHGLVSGNLTPDYFNNMIAFDKEQLATEWGKGISVPLDTLYQALAYVQANVQNTPATPTPTSSFSTDV